MKNMVHTDPEGQKSENHYIMDINYSRNMAKMPIHTAQLLRSHVCHSHVTRAVTVIKGETKLAWFFCHMAFQKRD